MKPSISSWERRDYRKPKELNFWKWIALIMWVAAISTWLYVLTPTVRAEDDIRFQDVHTEREACYYMHKHPETVTNVKWCDL